MTSSPQQNLPDDDILARYPFGKNVPVGGLMINGKPALTQIDVEEVAPYVLLFVRDPLCAYDQDPTAALSTKIDDYRIIGRSGMFTTCSGNFQGVPITAISGGSGGPEVELALMELFEHTQAHTFIRVGGSGGMNQRVRPGDLVVATGAVRDEATSQSYIPASFPAIAAPEVVFALAQAARSLGLTHHLGLVRSTDSDYVGGGRPAARGYFQPAHLDIVETWARAGVLNGDRESAPIITLATLFGHRGGSICSVADNIVTGEKFVAGAGHDDAIAVALAALPILRQMDYARDAAAANIWTPDLQVR